MTTRDSPPSSPTLLPPTVQPRAAPVAPRTVADLGVSDESAAVREAHSRALPPGLFPVVVLINGGAGARAEALRQRLRAVLSSDPRVTLAVAKRVSGPPVADPGVAGGHVNTQTVLITPRPDLVIGAVEHDGTLYLVGSDPGADGLGDVAGGRRWMIHFRAAESP